MVNFADYCSFPANQVESVGVSTSSTGEMRYRLEVVLKSGRCLSVSYRDKDTRDKERWFLCNRIDQELHQNDGQILGKLLMIEDGVRRIDGRQLRIWRQLKRLLRIQGDPSDGGHTP